MRFTAMLPATILALAMALPGAGRAAAAVPEAATSDLPNFTLSQPPKPVPPAAFKDAADHSLELSAFRGRVVLVNLWATWCAPCRAEMPALDRLQADLGGSDFQVVAIAQDRGGKDKATAFLEGVGAKHLQLYIDDTMRSGRTWGALGLPTTFLVDRQGHEVGRVLGPAEWDSPEAKALIRRFIDAVPAEKQMRTSLEPVRR